ncbi:hypothetical protein ACO1O0_005886 [Amphichorda felina]
MFSLKLLLLILLTPLAIAACRPSECLCNGVCTNDCYKCHDLDRNCGDPHGGIPAPPPDMPCWRTTAIQRRVCEGPNNVTAFGRDTTFRRAWYRDCRVLQDRWQKRATNGMFLVHRLPGDDKEVYYSTVYHGSCFLGVSPQDKHALLGDLDMERILNSAVTTAAKGILLAAEGHINCSTGDDMEETTRLKWRLYGGPYYKDWKADDRVPASYRAP